jgi:hypothetical protein
MREVLLQRRVCHVSGIAHGHAPRFEVQPMASMTWHGESTGYEPHPSSLPSNTYLEQPIQEGLMLLKAAGLDARVCA